MPERKYSVTEINTMRDSVRLMLIQTNVSFFQEEMDAKIEDQLRTYMANGTDPKELQEECWRVTASRQNADLSRTA